MKEASDTRETLDVPLCEGHNAEVSNYKFFEPGFRLACESILSVFPGLFRFRIHENKDDGTGDFIIRKN